MYIMFINFRLDDSKIAHMWIKSHEVPLEDDCLQKGVY